MRTTIALFLLLLACAPSRPTVDIATLAARRDDFYRDVAVDSATVARAFEQRVLTHGANSEDDSFDILVLSGGGAKGAFGAGFLRAWESRPEFDVVTGVSTGALIAPFAFVGTNEALDQIVSVYAHPKRDWLTTRTVAFLLGKASLFNAKGLHRELRSRIDASLLSAVAAQAKRSRVLMVGSTDLDLGVMRIWNLGSIASAGEERLFEDALLASSAIPGAFPPVEIDGQLYVDGGVSANFVSGIDPKWLRPMLESWDKRHPGKPIPRFRVWVVINGKLTVTPAHTGTGWPSVVKRSIDVLIRQSMHGMLYAYFVEARQLSEELNISVETRYVAIPSDYPEPEGKGFFDPKVMNALIALGQRMATDPKSWQTSIDVPDWPRPQPTPPTSGQAEASPPR